MIRLLELGFELQQFFYLLVNTWLYSSSKILVRDMAEVKNLARVLRGKLMFD